MTIGTVSQNLMAMVVGYRNTAVQGGVDPNLADFMAAQFHTAMLGRLFGTQINVQE